MGLLRHWTVALAVITALISSSEEGAAQNLKGDILIATQARWASGYMGLGGGLGKAMAARTNGRALPIARRPRRDNSARNAVAIIDDELPIFLISQTLDHTGMNIANLRTHRSR
jgi:hypothetical protein